MLFRAWHVTRNRYISYRTSVNHNGESFTDCRLFASASEEVYKDSKGGKQSEIYTQHPKLVFEEKKKNTNSE